MITHLQVTTEDIIVQFQNHVFPTFFIFNKLYIYWRYIQHVGTQANSWSLLHNVRHHTSNCLRSKFITRVQNYKSHFTYFFGDKLLTLIIHPTCNSWSLFHNVRHHPSHCLNSKLISRVQNYKFLLTATFDNFI